MNVYSVDYINTGFWQSGDYYVGTRRVLTNFFGGRKVLDYVTSKEKEETSRRPFFSTIFLEQMLGLIGEHKNLDMICNARCDTVLYDLPPAPTGKRGRP